MTQRRGGGGIPLGFNSVNRLNFLLPQTAGWGYDDARHRLPSKLFNVSVSPDTEHHKAATVAPQRKREWFVLGMRFSVH